MACAGVAHSQSRFCEINWYAVMEAENANSISGWNSTAGVSGTARIDASDNGYVTYEVTFTRTGNYYVFLLCKYTGSSSAERNDCFITLDGAKLYGSDNVTRPDGIRTHSPTFAWSGLPKGPGGSTPENIKNNPVYAKVSSAGTKTFKIGSRSQGFVVDKIQLQLANSTKPIGLSYDQTLCSIGPAKPYFRLQPESQIVQVNRTAVFTVEAGGTPVLSYQWQKGGVNIAGATNYRYSVSGTQLTDNGARYICVVTNSAGSTVSREVTLVVYDAAGGQDAEIEAEAMQLSGYTVDTGMNNNVITLPVGTATGTARHIFNGSAGSYFMAISVVPENDGRPKVSLAVNQTTVKSVTYPMDDIYANMAWRVQFIAEGIALKSGDVITVTGTADQQAYARVDKLIIVPQKFTALQDTGGKALRPGTMVAPNPVSAEGAIRCRVPGYTGTVRAVLYDITEKPVLTREITSTRDGYILSLAGAGMLPGMYLVGLYAERQTLMSRILVTK